MNAHTVFTQLLALDAQHIPYIDNEAYRQRGELIEQLNELGYTVGVGKGHKVVLRKLPEFNCLPPCSTLTERGSS